MFPASASPTLRDLAITPISLKAPLVTHARIEIFIEESRVKSIVDTIMECAHTGRAGDGIIVVLPVEQVYKIRRKAALDPSVD